MFRFIIVLFIEIKFFKIWFLILSLFKYMYVWMWFKKYVKFFFGILIFLYVGYLFWYRYNYINMKIK